MLKMYYSKRQRARAQGTKLVSLVRVRLLSGSDFVNENSSNTSAQDMDWSCRKVSEAARERRSEDARMRACKVGRLVGRKVSGNRRAKIGRDQK